MKNKILIISLSLNALLLGLVALLNYNFHWELKKTEWINNQRILEISMLESIMLEKVSKQEVLETFKKKFSENNFFDKPGENGIGAGSLFLKFDENNTLKTIETYKFKGP
ncbi:MAG: hypothetical protein H6856_04930 [Rhodospirillales bacterium]|nr:hypothetical protein [Rhodospirillales bacterium]